MKWYKKILGVIALALCLSGLHAHPMPASILLLDVRQNEISADLKWPLKELQMAFPTYDIDSNPQTLLQRRGAWLDQYLRDHMSVAGPDGRAWLISIRSRAAAKAEQTATGMYNELAFELLITPPPGASTRHFTIHYDAIMHQVVTHKLFVSVRQDWDRGVTEASTDADPTMMMLNLATGTVEPLTIDLDEGSRWTGFLSMVRLGVRHISEGTDHILFILVLLLPSMLIASGWRWASFGGTRFSLIRLVKLVTAFTIGHSVSLILGSLHILTLPQQPIEIAIGITILITAIHAIIPLFYGRELLLVLFFGMIHGLAFSTAISGLRLDTGRMALSILGFNVGIELTQLFIILCIFPWLMLLSRSGYYTGLRVAGGVVAVVASLGWIAERITGQANVITTCMNISAAHARWLLLALVAAGGLSMLFRPGKDD